MACTWFGEICSCCCVTVLLGPAWVLLSKIYKPFAGSLYRPCNFSYFVVPLLCPAEEVSSRVKPDQSSLTPAALLSLPLALVRLYQQKQGSYFERAVPRGESDTRESTPNCMHINTRANDADVIGPLPSFAASAALPGELEIS